MYRGAAYADSLQYQHCINLWKYALELRVAKDSILFCDTCFTAQVIHNVGLLIVNYVTCSHACSIMFMWQRKLPLRSIT